MAKTKDILSQGKEKVERMAKTKDILSQGKERR
jgi:hypothetical protein